MSIFLLFILAFMALPVIKLVSSALTAQATQTFSFENFEKIFTSAYYAQSFGNSLKLSLQCSVFGIIIALFCSYAITRFVSERTQNNLLVIVNMTSNFAGLPLGFALTLMLGTTGVFVILLQQMGIDITENFSIYSVQGLVIAYTYFQVPLGIMLLYPIYLASGTTGRKQLPSWALPMCSFGCASAFRPFCPAFFPPLPSSLPTPWAPMLPPIIWYRPATILYLFASAPL